MAASKRAEKEVLWGTFSPLVLKDPIWDILLHIMVNGLICVSIGTSQLSNEGAVETNENFDSILMEKIRKTISDEVKCAIKMIVENGCVSCFDLGEYTDKLNIVIQERLEKIFENYGTHIHSFKIEKIEIPDEDYAPLKQAQERAETRKKKGITWQEERQVEIAEKFAQENNLNREE